MLRVSAGRSVAENLTVARHMPELNGDRFIAGAFVEDPYTMGAMKASLKRSSYVNKEI